MKGIAIQSWLFGAASTNAFWHPTPITVDAIPIMAFLVFLAFIHASSAA